ncbi:MAG: hypothetical protein AAF533_25405 [Acidobacteriota bacterium]
MNLVHPPLTPGLRRCARVVLVAIVLASVAPELLAHHERLVREDRLMASRKAPAIAQVAERPLVSRAPTPTEPTELAEPVAVVAAAARGGSPATLALLGRGGWP